MRLDHYDERDITITLSRRNLLTLLVKLDGHPPDSMCSIRWPGRPDLIVHAEEDCTHYGARGYGPGPMHEETEQHLAS